MLTAKSVTQNITMTISGVSCYAAAGVVCEGHGSFGDRGRRRLNQITGRAGLQEAVDIKNAEGKYESVDGAEDGERDPRLARRQEWRYGVRRSQDPIDHPGLAAHFRRVPAGQDGNEGQREA